MPIPPENDVPPRLAAAIAAANMKFPYMPWPHFTDDKSQQLSPTPDVLAFLKRRGEFKPHLPLPQNTCPVCLENHDRKDCALVLAEGNLVWGQHELQRLTKTLASLKDDGQNLQQAPGPVAFLNTKPGKDGAKAFVDLGNNNNKIAIKHQRSMVMNHIAILDHISTIRKSLHEKLCNSRCDRYNHADGECAGTSFVEFEKVHTRELEMAEARRRKLQRNKERMIKTQEALRWKPMRGKMTDAQILHRNGMNLSDRKREEPKLEDPLLLSPCAGREPTTSRSSRRDGLRLRPTARKI